MHKLWITAIITASLTGCAQPPKKPDMPISQVAPTPICKGEAQCAAMWGRAIEGIQMVTRMKVAEANDTFIRTYPTRKIGYLNGQVFKQSLGDGEYAIKASIDCGQSAWCSNILNSGMNLFNTHVQGFEKRPQ